MTRTRQKVAFGERVVPRRLLATGVRAVEEADFVAAAFQLRCRQKHVGLGTAEGAKSFVDKQESHGLLQR
jgi:hypothetical protein